MSAKLSRLPKAAQKLWKRVSSEDTWGVPYVYETGARAVWNAAIRHERKRSAAVPRSHHLAARRTLRLLAGYLSQMPNALHAFEGGTMTTAELFEHASQCAALLKSTAK